MSFYSYLKTTFFLAIVSLAPFANAQGTVQSDCFETLKSNLKDIGMFKTPYQTIANMKYADLQSKFSRNYKNMSSFGVDLDEPLFELRLYSFGKQTGYAHPPISPFSVSTKSDTWDKPAKEYIVAEEYIRNPKGEKVFLSCSFMQIAADDLMKVTSDRYWYDGELLSALKGKNGDDYKFWYSENISYDYSRKPFVTWYRFFIYPKATKNDYYDKYTAIDSFPANKVDSFSFLTAPPTPSLGNGTGATKTGTGGKTGANGKAAGTPAPGGSERFPSGMKIMFTDEFGMIKSYVGPKELAPIKREGNNSIFPLYDFYSNTENAFPEFSKKMAVRGEIHMDTVKKIMGTKDNVRYAHIWNTVLNPNRLTKYYMDKKMNKLSNEDKKSMLNDYGLKLVGNFENEIRRIDQGEVQREKASELEKGKKSLGGSDQEGAKMGNYTILASVILVIVIATILSLSLKKKPKGKK